jgi:hypothetical protein
MVNAMTPREEQYVRDYDAMTEKQIQDERPVVRKCASLSDLYRVFEAVDLDGIKELHLDIGVMREILERLQEWEPTYQWLQYFIRVELNMIDNLTEDIQRRARHGRWRGYHGTRREDRTRQSLSETF